MDEIDHRLRLSALYAHSMLRSVLDHSDPNPALAAAARDGLEMLALVYEADQPKKAAELARVLTRLTCLIAYAEIEEQDEDSVESSRRYGSDGSPVSAEVAVWLPPTGTKH